MPGHSLDNPAPAPVADTPTPLARWLRRPIVWIAVLVIVVVAAVVALQSRGPVVPTTMVRRADIAQHVVASGRVRVATRVQVAALVSGRVTRVDAREGRHVTSGDLLVRLDDREQRSAVAQARAAVDQARSRLAQLQQTSRVVASETSRQAAAALEQAEAELSRVTTLAAAGAVSQATLEDAQRAVDIARAQKRAADAQAAAVGTDGPEWQAARAAVLESEARLAAAQAQLADTTVIAPASGVILSRAVEPGDAVLAGAPLLELAAEGVTELIIEPDERNLAWIAPGQMARVSADAFPDVEFDAVVRYIAPSVDARRGSIEVRLDVPTPPPFLRPDMTVSVDLTVASKSNAVVVPSEAVQGMATEEPYVWVVDQGRVAREGVTLGIRGSGHTELASGPAPGVEVALATPRPLVDGERVRLRPEDR